MYFLFKLCVYLDSESRQNDLIVKEAAPSSLHKILIKVGKITVRSTTGNIEFERAVFNPPEFHDQESWKETLLQMEPVKVYYKNPKSDLHVPVILKNGNDLTFNGESDNELFAVQTYMEFVLTFPEPDTPFIRTLGYKLIENVKYLISATFAAKNPNVIEVKLTGLLKNTQEALHFQQYLDIAKYTELDDPLFKDLTEGICNLTDRVYNPEIRPMAPQAISYASIVGPSYMGKTQFAFSLARFCPVFYANFASSEHIQDVYQAFSEISTIFIKCLSKDVKTLGKIGLNSGDILQKAFSLKLETIGFLWYLIEYSTEFRGFDQGAAPSDSEWFKYYLEKREVKYETMTYRSYLQKLSKISLFISNIYFNLFVL